MRSDGTRASRVVRTLLLVLAGGAAALLPETALAYGGPGSIVSGIGAFLAAVVAVAAAIVGFFWFPLKRLYRKVRGGGEEEKEEVAEAP